MGTGSDYPTVSDAHTTDRQAKAIVERLLAKDWLVKRMPEYDYGHDYLIEAVIGSQPSGNEFHAQLKGTKTVTFDPIGRAHWALETRHLRYYWDRVDVPVFLMLVDVTAEQGWFCFVQGELATQTAQERLTCQKTITLDLRIDNSLANTTKLRAALDSARLFMREKNPGSVKAALRAAAPKFVRNDPHFEITGAEVDGAHTCLKIAPKGPFSFSIRVPPTKASIVAPRIKELFCYGRPLEVNTDEVEFENLPLFANAKADGLRGHLAFRPDDSLECEITISANRKGILLSLVFPSRLTRGTEGGLLIGQLKDAPLGIELKLSRRDLAKNKAATIEFKWDFARWVDKSLVTLPQLEPLVSFWETLLRATPINLVVTQSGNRLFGGRFGGTQLPEHYQEFYALCLMLRKAREVAIALHLQTKIPAVDQLYAFDWTDIDIAHALIRGRGYKRTDPNLSMSFNPYPDNDRFSILFRDRSEVGGSVRLEIDSYSIQVFGESWNLGGALQEMGPITCHLQKQDDGTALVQVRGGENTVLRIVKMKDEARIAPAILEA